MSIVSPEGEILALTKTLQLLERPLTSGKHNLSDYRPIPVEVWLNNLEKLMIVAVKHSIIEAYHESLRGLTYMELIKVSHYIGNNVSLRILFAIGISKSSGFVCNTIEMDK